MIQLANPYALVLLLFVPLLWWCQHRQRPVAIAYPTVQTWAQVPRSAMARLRRGMPSLRLMVLVLGILALARPQQGLQATKVYSEGIAIVMVVDISGSMSALDLRLHGEPRNRLDVVKHTFRNFVRGADGLGGRDGDLIGMVTFARYADSVSPLTLDHDTLLSLLDEIAIVSQPEEDGTAIGEAIAMGVDRLREATARSRVMILLTDGANNAGEVEPQQAARIAKALGIKIYTIGTGTRGIAPVPVRTRDGRLEMRQMRVFIDEATLKEIASITDGRYFRATDSETLVNIYRDIDRLEKSANVAEQYQQYAERFAWFLLPALALLLLEVILVNTRLRTIP
jgi:Ca-activated chloride channel family protein